jgi:hypothetical protein
MDHTLQEYFKKVEEVTGEKNFEFFRMVEDLIKSEFSKISQTKIKGIVFGTVNCSTRRSSQLYISTGSYERNDLSKGKLDMLDRLAILNNVCGIIYLRVPLIASLQKEKTEQLINAFKPIVAEFYKHIMKKNVDFEELIYIFSLGKNSLKVATECLEAINRPRFLLIPSVHPNHMRQMDSKIKKAKSSAEKLRLKRRQVLNYNIFEQGLRVFINHVC